MPRRGTAGANLVRLPMVQLLVIAATFFVLWLLFIRPQQRRVRAHQALVATLEPGDEVILTAGIYGRIVELGPEDMVLTVAPGVDLTVARQAVLRKVEDATEPAEPAEPEDAPAEPDEAGPSAPEPNV
jgi:preprotein translocase subunit YajC